MKKFSETLMCGASFLLLFIFALSTILLFIFIGFSVFSPEHGHVIRWVMGITVVIFGTALATYILCLCNGDFDDAKKIKSLEACTSEKLSEPVRDRVSLLLDSTLAATIILFLTLVGFFVFSPEHGHSTPGILGAVGIIIAVKTAMHILFPYDDYGIEKTKRVETCTSANFSETLMCGASLLLLFIFIVSSILLFIFISLAVFLPEHGNWNPWILGAAGGILAAAIATEILCLCNGDYDDLLRNKKVRKHHE